MSYEYENAVEKMAERRSVRSYREERIPDEVMEKILQAGLNTGSGGNLQPFSILMERDKAQAKKLSQLLKYPFIAGADVNLLFVLDWYKLARYSRCRQAPFVENRSTSHFFIAWDDTLLSAQAIESAAWLCGIGSCFVGHVMDCVPELKEMYDLPEMTFPVILLSMGYPKTMPPKSAKLQKNMMVFEGRYPKLDDEQICSAFDTKYEGRKLELSADNAAFGKRADDFCRALLAAGHSQEEAEQILQKAVKRGSLTEIQRLFGIHYHPDRELGDTMTPQLHEQKLYPF